MLLKFLKTKIACVTSLTNILKKTKSRCQQKTCVLTTRAFVFYYGNLRHRLFKVWVDCIRPAQNRIRWSISYLTFYMFVRLSNPVILYIYYTYTLIILNYKEKLITFTNCMLGSRRCRQSCQTRTVLRTWWDSNSWPCLLWEFVLPMRYRFSYRSGHSVDTSVRLSNNSS